MKHPLPPDEARMRSAVREMIVLLVIAIPIGWSVLAFRAVRRLYDPR